MSRSSRTHQQQIARALQRQLGGAISYQEALRRVRAAAEGGLLPRPLDGEGRAEAVRRLAAAHPPAAPATAITASGLHTVVVEAFRAAGWPVEAETSPESGRYLSYPGPITMAVGRDPADAGGVGTVGGGPDDPGDPDDGAAFDISQPPVIRLAAPLVPERGDQEVETMLPGTAEPRQVVAAARNMVAAGRSRILKAGRNDTPCVVCGDPYPSDHLMGPAEPGRRSACPACVFDQDMPWQGPVPVLALQLDRLRDRDLTVPAGWSAVTALLACLGGPEMCEAIERAWRTDGILYTPMEGWSGPDDIWIWLPERPICTALAEFGPGAPLTAVVRALDKAYPALRDRVRTELADTDAEIAAEYGEEDQPRPDRFVEAVWPALIAYVVTLLTQAAERPDQRPPLEHVSGSFDLLPDYMLEIGSDLNPDDVVSTLECGLELLPPLLRGRGLRVLDGGLGRGGVGKTVSTGPLPGPGVTVIVDHDPQPTTSGQDGPHTGPPDDARMIFVDVPGAMESLLPDEPRE